MQNLKPFHTFGLTVQANKIIEITSIEQLKQEWDHCQARNEPVLFLGMGSNVLFTEDFHGTVMLNRLKGINQTEDEQHYYLHVNGGENWHELVEWAVNQDIGGLENLALIPGCAGSAPIQNIGAYGVEFKDVCEYVDVLNLASGEVFRLSNDECEFGYRESVFKHRLAQGYVIIAVGLKLAKQWQPILKYGELCKLDKTAVKKRDVFQIICETRGGKLPEPSKIGNAGSFFKNPVINKNHFNLLQQQYETIPHFPQADGTIKLAAGWLIDQCGLKGFSIGTDAAVHQHQALVLTNQGNASALDLLDLAQYVRQAVGEKFNVWLRPEVRFIGRTGEIDALQAITRVDSNMNFNSILATLPTIDHLAELQIRNQDGELIHTIPAIAGKLGSLRVYNALSEQFDGMLNTTAAQKGLQLFAEHVIDAKQYSGKHPNIDLLLNVIAKNTEYYLITVEKHNGRTETVSYSS